MTTLREKLETRNDELWTDAERTKNFYTGAQEAHTEIDHLLDQMDTESDLAKELRERIRTASASAESAEDGETYSYYDGMRDGYRNILHELTGVMEDFENE